jgi:hypothetical protein
LKHYQSRNNTPMGRTTFTTEKSSHTTQVTPINHHKKKTNINFAHTKTNEDKGLLSERKNNDHRRFTLASLKQN